MRLSFHCIKQLRWAKVTNNKQITAGARQLTISEWQIAMHYQMANGNFAARCLNRFIVISRLQTFVISIPPLSSQPLTLSSRAKSRDMFGLIVKDFSTTLRFGRDDWGYIGNFAVPSLNRYSLIANAWRFAIRHSPITSLGAL